jgi:D-glycero-D-manno-heptose 1,7-bisphosphate phosphatase
MRNFGEPCGIQRGMSNMNHLHLQGRAVFLEANSALLQQQPGDAGAITQLAPGAGDGLRLLARLGFRLMLATNQSGIALGRIDAAGLHAVLTQLQSLLQEQGVAMDAVYVCPHGIDSACRCRKPMPGMLRCAAIDHGIDLSASWVVGDVLHDMEAGKRAGCRTLLIDNSHETEWELNEWRTPDLLAPDLHAAARLIRHAGQRRADDVHGPASAE